MKLIVAALLLVCCCQAEEGPYEGYRQIMVNSVNHEWQFDILRLLRDKGRAILWEDYRPASGTFDFLLAPEGIESAMKVIKASGMITEVLTDNFQRQLDESFEKFSKQRAYDPASYNRYVDIYSEIDRLASNECPSGFSCNVRTVGTTHEGKDIRIISITQGSGRRAIYYDSLIHAREWLAGSTVMLILDRLMTGYGSDAIATTLLNNYDFHCIPVVNPDGYDYSWQSTDTRMWRKNRVPNPGSSCLGVDLNRNTDGPWNAGGSSSSPCSDLYHGPSANSELETQAYQAEITRLGNIELFVSVHSYAYMYLIPYGTNAIYPNCNQYPDYADLYRNVQAAVNAIHEVSPSPTWTYGEVCNVIYVASGGSLDWAKLRAGIKYTVTPELRGPGFNPPVTAITPSFNENYAALGAMVDYMMSS